MKFTAAVLSLAFLAAAGRWPGQVRAGEPERIRLRTQHVDVAVIYQPVDETNKFAIVVSDDDHGVTYQSKAVALVAPEAARLALPPGTVFGDADAPFWVLPQSQNPDVLYLGLSGEALPAGTLAGEVELRLVEVRGPGHFFLWQSGAFGEFDLRMSSADGVSEEDRIEIPTGGHAHFNWGFTSNGVYDVVLRVTGRRAGVETNDFSLPTALRFEVEPVPAETASPFARWQRAQWPESGDAAIIGPDADPDGDLVVNAVEYALGLNPHGPDRHLLPQPRIRRTGAGDIAILEFSHPVAASDVRFTGWMAAALDQTPWVQVAGPEVLSAGAPVERLAFTAGQVTPGAPVFVRLEVTLAP